MNYHDHELNIKTDSIMPNQDKKEENVINFLTNVKNITMCILQDVYTYSNNLQDFLQYYQNLSGDDLILHMMVKRLEIISELFYKSVINHLSVYSCEYGINNKLIKPVDPECGKTTTIKHFGMKKTFGSRQMQNTINVGTLDNISIHKVIDENIVISYNVMIGELTYVIDINSKNVHMNIIDIANAIQNILEDIEISLNTNIEYIKKCIFVFKTNIK
jgi:hypothetical protein